MEIRCKKSDCKFNTGVSCKAKKVNIESNTVACETYDKDAVKENIIVSHGNLFDVTDKMGMKNANNVPLKCEAENCLFNKDEKCVANGITVIDGKSSTPPEAANNTPAAACATFIKE